MKIKNEAEFKLSKTVSIVHLSLHTYRSYAESLGLPALVAIPSRELIKNSYACQMNNIIRYTYRNYLSDRRSELIRDLKALVELKQEEMT